MNFTPEMEAAYRRGLEMSKREHRLRSIRLAIEQSPMAQLFEGSAETSFRSFRRPPLDVVEEYGSTDEASAFFAGWIDGSQYGDGSLRAMIEGDEAPTTMHSSVT